MLLKSLILTGAVNGLFFILLLQTKDKKSGADSLLAAWMGLISLQLFFYYDNLSLKPILPVYLQLPAFSIPLLSSPVLYFYIKGLAFGKPLVLSAKVYHLFPYVLFNLIGFYLVYALNNALILTNGLPHFGTATSKIWIYILPGLLAVVPGYYSIAGLFVLLKYQKLLPDNYSYTEKINLNWLKWMVIVMIGLFLGLFVLIKFGVSLGWTNYENLFAVVGAILTLYVFFIGFWGFKQYNFAGNASPDHQTASESIAPAALQKFGIKPGKGRRII